jgi:glycine/D-amino acid oxidase-like deaminating enzyme
VRLQRARVEGVDVLSGRVRAVHLSDSSGSFTVETGIFVNAAGPFVNEVAQMVGADLPVFCEIHTKIAFNDTLGIIPATAPLYYWADPQLLPWTAEERELVAESDDRWLLDPFPPGPHGLAEGTPGSRSQLILWTYDVDTFEPVVPLPPVDPHYFEVVLRGLSRMLPGLEAYFDRLPRPAVDGGYYTKTRENRPLIGPLPAEGAFVIGALSGFGIMAACGAGELLAAHVTGAELPDYAPWFLLDRYDDPEYLALLDSWDASGQL